MWLSKVLIDSVPEASPTMEVFLRNLNQPSYTCPRSHPYAFNKVTWQSCEHQLEVRILAPFQQGERCCATNLRVSSRHLCFDSDSTCSSAGASFFSPTDLACPVQGVNKKGFWYFMWENNEIWPKQKIHNFFIYPCPVPPCANYLHLPYGCQGTTTQPEVTNSV